jgi:hypothetical protein
MESEFMGFSVSGIGAVVWRGCTVYTPSGRKNSSDIVRDSSSFHFFGAGRSCAAGGLSATIAPPVFLEEFAMANTQHRVRPAVFIAVLGLLFAAPLASAHHSAALFYNMGGRISLKGEVMRWSFRNPHAIVELDVKNAKGEIEHWTCETSAPSALRRSGWSQESLHAGEIVTIDGIPARDGTKLMRITGVTKADGTKIGTTGKTDD